MHKIQGPFILIYFSWLYEHFRLKKKKSAGHLMWWDVQPRDLLIWKALQPEPVFFGVSLHILCSWVCECIWRGAFIHQTEFVLNIGRSALMRKWITLCASRTIYKVKEYWPQINTHTQTLRAFSSHPEACTTIEIRFHKKTATGDRRSTTKLLFSTFQFHRQKVCVYVAIDRWWRWM